MLLTTRETANRLSVITKTIYRRIAAGSLPAIRLSEKDLRIDEVDLKQFIEKMKIRKEPQNG